MATLFPERHGRRIVVLKEPIGVFAAITSWNFPAPMITHKASPDWTGRCGGARGVHPRRQRVKHR